MWVLNHFLCKHLKPEWKVTKLRNPVETVIFSYLVTMAVVCEMTLVFCIGRAVAQ